MVTMAELEMLDKAKLAEACETALNCFRALYDDLQDVDEAQSILEDKSYWPLSLLRFALGSENDKEQAEENWKDGKFIGPDDDEEEDYS